MGKKVKDDQIKWYLVLDAKGVQGEIQKLSSSTVKLENDNKRLAKEMAEAKNKIKDTEKEMRRLQKAGEEQSIQYKILESTLESTQEVVASYTKEIENNSKAILDNNKEIETAIKEMRLENMTMSQLKTRASYLRKELNNTSKAADPERYKELKKGLSDTEKQMSSLGERTKSLCDTLNTMRGVIGANIASKLASKIVEWTKAAIEFTKEGIKMAASAQGVQEAFNRIATSDDLKSLRKDTKGLVNDFDLMKAAVRAENFNIPLNQLGKLLQFAQQRAKDTGESVDYLVDSIVNGIGRKSPLILDNLGISASKLNEEVKKTGDFAGAVAKIVEEEMSKVGESIDTAAETATQKAVALENLQLTLGKRFLGMQEAWDKMTTGLVQGLTKVVEVQKSHKEQYTDQIQKVADLEVNTAKLVRRYDELETKTELSTDEQIELNKIMNILSSTVPGAVTEFDKYGNALSINTQKVWDFIAAEKVKLQYMNRNAIKEETENLNKYTEKYEEYSKKVDAINRGDTLTKWVGVSTSVSAGVGGGSFEPLSDEEIADIRKKQAEYKGLMDGAQAYINEMNGTTIENQLTTQEEVIENRNKFNDMTKKQLEDYIKINKDAKDKYVDIAQQTYHNRFGTSDKGGGSGDKTKNKEAEKMAEEQKKIINDMAMQMDIATKSYNDKLKSEGLFQIELTKLTEEELNKRLELDKQYQDELTNIALEGEKSRFEKAKNTAGVDGDSSDFTEQQNDVLELLQQQHEANIQKIKDDSAKSQIDIQKSIDSSILDSLQKSYQSQLDAISATEKAKIISLQNEFSEGLKTYEEYNKEIESIESNSLASRIVAQENYINTLKALTNPSDEQQKELIAAEQVLIDMQIQSNNTAINKQIELEEKKKSIREQYGLVSLSEQYDAELELLKQAHEEGLLSEEEFEQAKLQLKLKYAAEYAQKAQQLLGAASDTVSALMDAETSNVEERYNAEIAAAGDNKEEVERLENEKAKKKLDIEKKYADVQFAITAAEIISNTAMAVMQAYAQLGPIAGSVAAALMGITGAMQLKAANAQRQKVKQMTLSGNSSGGDSPKTGEIKMKEGFADGGSNTGDYTDGGYTGKGDRYEVAGWVPYHHGEYFVAVPEMKDPAVQDHVRAIDKIRRKRTVKNSLPKGFADGGANISSSSFAGIQQDQKTNKKLVTLLDGLISGKIAFRTNYGVTEYEAAQKEKAEYESKFDLTE